VSDLQKRLGIDMHKVSSLAWWGLVEDEGGRREDGGRRGYWRPTRLGIDFVNRRASVRYKVRIYDARVLDFQEDWVTIGRCLGDQFSYNELMYGGSAPAAPRPGDGWAVPEPTLPGQLELA
jgi:hypothetical protein